MNKSKLGIVEQHETSYRDPRTKRTIREEAEFLALEIHTDAWATKGEIADAIEHAILCYTVSGRYNRKKQHSPV